MTWADMKLGPEKVAWVIALPFAITFCDSAFAYFMRPFGIGITANALIPAVLLYMGLFLGRNILSISRTYVIWLGVLVWSMSIAVVTAEQVSTHRILEAGSCAASFYSGYLLWRRCNDERQLSMILISLSLLYVAICVVALRTIDPAHFPVTVNYWNMNGVGQARPTKITADANMQFYYLFPAALTLVLPSRLIRTSVAILAAIGTLYILSKMQTRSGVIIFGLVLLMTLAAPIWKRDLGRKKTIIAPIFGLVAAIIAWPIFESLAGALIYRFHDETMASGNGRVGSTLYVFQHLFDPYWWVPRGPDEFLKSFGGLPHSNLTGIYLDAGLLGLLAWIMLVLRPVVKMTSLFFKGRLDSAGVMVLIAASAVVILQLTLYNTTMDQVWLWAGALAGALSRAQAAPETRPIAGQPLIRNTQLSDYTLAQNSHLSR
jgi:O-antigen ligase